MKNKKRIILIVFYIALVGLVYFTSSTLSKYVSTNKTEADFTLGEKLYFEYTRGDLYRGDQLIIGVPIDVPIMKDGVQVGSKNVIETMNVAPGDELRYTFTVSNKNESGTEYNSVEAEYHVSATAILQMPTKQSSYSFNCIIKYAEIGTDGKPLTYTDLPQDRNLDLPKYLGTPATESKYAFEVQVILDGQVEATSKEDYIGATLTIYLFIDAANK